MVWMTSTTKEAFSHLCINVFKIHKPDILLVNCCRSKKLTNTWRENHPADHPHKKLRADPQCLGALEEPRGVTSVAPARASCGRNIMAKNAHPDLSQTYSTQCPIHWFCSIDVLLHSDPGTSKSHSLTRKCWSLPRISLGSGKSSEWRLGKGNCFISHLL